MSVIDDIVEKIQQIINISSTAYVYADECISLSETLRDLLSKIQNIEVKQSDEETYSQLLEKLNDLYNTIYDFQQENWFNACFQCAVMDPIYLLIEIMKSINESLDEINIKLDNEYKVPIEHIINELKTLYGIYNDPSQQDDPRFKEKLKEIEQYFHEIGQPLFDSTHKKKKKRTKKKKSVREETNQKNTNKSSDSSSLNDNSVEDEEFNDFSDIQKYKLQRSDYTQDPTVKSYNGSYTLYKGKLNSTNEDIHIIVLEEKEDAEKKFKRLVSVLIAAQHPNLESFIGAVDQPPYVVVTRRIGQKLNKILLLKKKKKQKNESKSTTIYDNGNRTIIAYKIASAMAYLHSINIIHRDLCTANVTIDENFNPKIINFVNSRFLPEDVSTMSCNQSPSANFRAIELLINEENSGNYDESVDVFSFGGILYELLTGKPPFYYLDQAEVEEKIKSKERPEFTTDIIDNYSKLKNLIEKCWEQDPQKRPSFAEIINMMLEQQICFPSDEIYANNFYSTKFIINSDINDCIDLFRSIQLKINQSYQYKRELFRIRSYLHAYQFVLLNSDYATKDEIKEAYVIINFSKLHETLKKIDKKISLISEDAWDGIHTNAVSITTDIYQYMETVYISMTELGFKVSKYELVNSDLITDFRRIYAALKEFVKDNEEEEGITEELVEQSKLRLQEISDFMKQRGLPIKISPEEISENLQKALSTFASYYIDRNDFKNKKLIGKGYSADVYKALQKSTGKTVAIKIFNKKYLKKDGIMQYLRREVYSLVRLKHKYLVKFVGFNNDPSKELWIVTEIAKDGCLFDANIEKKLTPYQKTKISFEIAQGMEYLHLNGFIHRDLKTSNVLLVDDTPKITDFGYTRIAASTTITNCIGTTVYMSPENVNGDSYSYGNDIFTFGMLLWELYAEMVPYNWVSEDEVQDVILKNNEMPYDDPISDDLKNLIEDTRNRNPNKRPSFTEIIERMMSDKIHFPGADMNEIEEFYKMKTEERELEKNKE